MKSKISYINRLMLACLVMALGLSLNGCSDDEKEILQAQLGYAQFKLFKSASYNKSSGVSTNELDYLAIQQLNGRLLRAISDVVTGIEQIRCFSFNQFCGTHSVISS